MACKRRGWGTCRAKGKRRRSRGGSSGGSSWRCRFTFWAAALTFSGSGGPAFCRGRPCIAPPASSDQFRRPCVVAGRRWLGETSGSIGGDCQLPWCSHPCRLSAAGGLLWRHFRGPDLGAQRSASQKYASQRHVPELQSPAPSLPSKRAGLKQRSRGSEGRPLRPGWRDVGPRIWRRCAISLQAVALAAAAHSRHCRRRHCRRPACLCRHVHTALLAPHCPAFR